MAYPKNMKDKGPTLVNIVFDIGNVICEWNPRKLVESVFSSKEEQTNALLNIIGHNDWLMLDKGTLPLEEAIPKAVARCGLQEHKILELFQRTPRSLIPFPETIALISELKEKKFNLFVLSNMHGYAFEYLLSEYSFWSNFSGIVISSTVKSIKPEPEIYQHLLNHHNLSAEETIFLDDMVANVKAANDHGIQTMLVKDPKAIKRDLSKQLEMQIV